MKVGDWVVTREGRVGKVTITSKGKHLVGFTTTKDGTYYTSEEYLTPITKEVADILIAVEQQKEK